jgi:chloride channel protein, CIC family
MLRKQFAEHGTMFVSILKWTVLATIVGVAVGLSTTLFLKVLDYSMGRTEGFPYYFILLPAGLFVSNLVPLLIDKEAAGEGLDKVINAIHKKGAKVSVTVAPAKFIASVLTIAAGGSAGKEAPPVQVGAALASWVSRALRMEKGDRKKLVICSISAGFASVFGAPIAGSIFGIEALFLGQLTYDVLFPSFVSGIVAYQVSLSWGIRYFTKEITVFPVFSEGVFFKVILAGMVFGLVSLLFIEAMKFSDKVFHKMKIPFPLKGALAGLVLAILTFILGDKSYLGMGLHQIESAVQGGHVPFAAFLYKILFTAITLGSGASGGIITPIFYVGVSAGSAFGRLFGFDPATFAVIGMAAVLAGTANTPISAGILAMELFGVRMGTWAATASVVSYLMVGNRSIHASQVVAALKSSSVRVPLNVQVGDTEAIVTHRDKGVLGLARRIDKGMLDLAHRIIEKHGERHGTNNRKHLD